MARLADITVLVVSPQHELSEALIGRLVAEGARIVAATEQPTGSATAAEQPTAGHAATGEAADNQASSDARIRRVELDPIDPASWDRLMAEIGTIEGALHGVVHVASHVETGRLSDMPAERLRATIDANLVAPALGMRSTAALLAASGGGSIVTIASHQAQRGAPNAAASAASSWGLRGLTRSAALELGASGIRVNTVYPSLGLLHDDTVALADGGTERRVTSGDVAAMVVFLLSDDSATCTGGDFLVDAGASA